VGGRRSSMGHTLLASLQQPGGGLALPASHRVMLQAQAAAAAAAAASAGTTPGAQPPPTIATTTHLAAATSPRNTSPRARGGGASPRQQRGVPPGSTTLPVASLSIGLPATGRSPAGVPGVPTSRSPGAGGGTRRLPHARSVTRMEAAAHLYAAYTADLVGSTSDSEELASPGMEGEREADILSVSSSGGDDRGYDGGGYDLTALHASESPEEGEEVVPAVDWARARRASAHMPIGNVLHDLISTVTHSKGAGATSGAAPPGHGRGPHGAGPRHSGGGGVAAAAGTAEEEYDVPLHMGGGGAAGGGAFDADLLVSSMMAANDDAAVAALLGESGSDGGEEDEARMASLRHAVASYGRNAPEAGLGLALRFGGGGGGGGTVGIGGGRPAHAGGGAATRLGATSAIDGAVPRSRRVVDAAGGAPPQAAGPITASGPTATVGGAHGSRAGGSLVTLRHRPRLASITGGDARTAQIMLEAAAQASLAGSGGGGGGAGAASALRGRQTGPSPTAAAAAPPNAAAMAAAAAAAAGVASGAAARSRRESPHARDAGGVFSEPGGPLSHSPSAPSLFARAAAASLSPPPGGGYRPSPSPPAHMLSPSRSVNDLAGVGAGAGAGDDGDGGAPPTFKIAFGSQVSPAEAAALREREAAETRARLRRAMDARAASTLSPPPPPPHAPSADAALMAGLGAGSGGGGSSSVPLASRAGTHTVGALLAAPRVETLPTRPALYAAPAFNPTFQPKGLLAQVMGPASTSVPVTEIPPSLANPLNDWAAAPPGGAPPSGAPARAGWKLRRLPSPGAAGEVA